MSTPIRTHDDHVADVEFIRATVRAALIQATLAADGDLDEHQRQFEQMITVFGTAPHMLLHCVRFLLTTMYTLPSALRITPGTLKLDDGITEFDAVYLISERHATSRARKTLAATTRFASLAEYVEFGTTTYAGGREIGCLFEATTAALRELVDRHNPDGLAWMPWNLLGQFIPSTRPAPTTAATARESNEIEFSRASVRAALIDATLAPHDELPARYEHYQQMMTELTLTSLAGFMAHHYLLLALHQVVDTLRLNHAGTGVDASTAEAVDRAQLVCSEPASMVIAAVAGGRSFDDDVVELRDTRPAPSQTAVVFEASVVAARALVARHNPDAVGWKPWSVLGQLLPFTR